MDLIDLNTVSTDQLHDLRDSAKRVAVKHARELGRHPLTAAAWLVWQCFERALVARVGVELAG